MIRNLRTFCEKEEDIKIGGKSRDWVLLIASFNPLRQGGIPSYLSAISEKNPPFLPTRMKKREEEEEERASVSKV